MNRWIGLGLMLLISLLGVACGGTAPNNTAGPVSGNDVQVNAEESGGEQSSDVVFPTVDAAELASSPPIVADLSLIANTGRPQFLDSYATWCSVCQANKPIVYTMSDRFAGEIDFFELDIDDPTSDNVRDQFDITGRFQYVMIDADGNVLRRWFGPLDQADLELQIAEILADLES